MNNFSSALSVLKEDSQNDTRCVIGCVPHAILDEMMMAATSSELDRDPVLILSSLIHAVPCVWTENTHRTGPVALTYCPLVYFSKSACFGYCIVVYYTYETVDEGRKNSLNSFPLLLLSGLWVGIGEKKGKNKVWPYVFLLLIRLLCCCARFYGRNDGYQLNSIRKTDGGKRKNCA